MATLDPTKQPKSKRPEYAPWKAMISRCLNPKDSSFKYYGERGITICNEWAESMDAFILEIGPRPSPEHSIDRIDNDGGYHPGNVRWATHGQQSRNRRYCLKVSVNGQTVCAAEASRITGVNKATIAHRVKAGWAAGDVLSAESFRRPGVRKPKVVCPRGHALTPENSIPRPPFPTPACRICEKAKNKARNAARRHPLKKEQTHSDATYAGLATRGAKSAVVFVRLPRTCTHSDPHPIPSSTLALREHGYVDGVFVSTYHCLACLDATILKRSSATRATV